MKKLIILLVIILPVTTFSSFGQRKMNWTMKDELQRQLGIPFLSKCNNDIDLRIFVDESLTPEGQVLWIRQKGQEWKATLYDYVLNFDENGNDKKEVHSFKSRELKPKEDWNDVWKKLVQFDILTLPNQADVTYELTKEARLHKEGGKERHSNFTIVDGAAYDLMVKVKSSGKSKNYAFHSPCNQLDNFPDSKELKNYCNIISTLEKELKVKLE